MKAKHLTPMIVCALLISFTGCAADKIAPTPTHNVDDTVNTEVTTAPEVEAEAATLAAETAEKEMPAQPASTETPQPNETAKPAQVKESEASKQTEAPRQSESTEPSAPSAPPEPTTPEPPVSTEPPVPTELPAPVETEPPVETQPKTAYDYEFDINAIRADCIAIGQSMGYALNTSLTPQNATWWNPVTASEFNQGSALRSGLEQYIRFHTVSNLSAYGLDEIAEFNICCESIGGGAYAIYFVFA